MWIRSQAVILKRNESKTQTTSTECSRKGHPVQRTDTCVYVCWLLLMFVHRLVVVGLLCLRYQHYFFPSFLFLVFFIASFEIIQWNKLSTLHLLGYIISLLNTSDLHFSFSVFLSSFYIELKSHRN